MTTSLVWFRRDLRCFDHAALHHALVSSQQSAAHKVVCVFIFDSTILSHLPHQDRRVAFIWHSLQQLKTSLIEQGSDLVIRHGDPTILIPQLAQEFEASAVYANHDIEPQAIARDQQVADTLAAQAIAFYDFKDQVIFEKDQILTQGGNMYQVFTPYKRAWLAALTPEHIRSYPVQPHFNQLARIATQTMPSLTELGFAEMDVEFLKPGMDGGELLFNDFCQRIGRYHEARDFPAVKGVSYLSVHLRFGTVSIRELVRATMQIGGAGAEIWLSELIWREFYQQLLWHRPELVEHTFKPEYDTLAFPNNPDWFAAWCAGQTGFPLVDAAMRQLNQSGFMHNRLRMVAASFLVKDLLIDWRWGEQYFATHLNDFDLSANNGGWQWAASTGCDAQPYFRIFNPVSQSQRFDPEGTFIRRYCPELAHLNNKQIHAPWLSSHTTPGYPEPIVDHAVQRQEALALFKRG